MPKVFPTCLFAPNGVDADIDLRVISGAPALNGVEDLIGTDGGGKWSVEFAELFLDDPIVGRAYRAVSALSDGGLTPFFVPFCDHRYQPEGSGTMTVPHSDGTPFSDESEYSQLLGAMTAASAPLRATKLTVSGGLALQGGETFSVDHPVHRHRCYRIADVTGPVITIRPPLREAIGADTTLNFADPMCTMRVDGGMRSPTSFGFIDAPTIRLVEHFPGPEGYL